ncbi:hypothetical protein AV656_09885 [Bhargavaea cecembensis]|uniref:Xylose isomerase-like TIM barrel domain-containing protein n=1 Tax=Bhargavaea cecembensis TaxID=394098 RepID=A0A163F2X9_9BACL|nr:sugar phosphate isomerase/epimerase family protein [Bhargavaea cecembensis]KZE37826.1 hypothetical protein AV656_09885 [Bhargavaea cecembensis]
MFTIGTSSDVLRHLPLKKAIEVVSSHGFDGIELWMGHITGSGLASQEIKSLLAESGLSYQIHADVRDINLTSINPGIRKESVRQTFETIDYAKELGASLITLHPGRMSSSKDRAEDLWPAQIESFKKIAAYSEQAGLKIGVENMEKRPKEFVLTVEEVSRLIDEVGSPSLGLTLDLAHCHSIGDVGTFVEEIRVPIFNVHISQASKSNMHLPFNTEAEDRINFGPVLEKLSRKYDGMLINESYEYDNEIGTLTLAGQVLSDLTENYLTTTSNSIY